MTCLQVMESGGVAESAHPHQDHSLLEHRRILSAWLLMMQSWRWQRSDEEVGPDRPQSPRHAGVGLPAGWMLWIATMWNATHFWAEVRTRPPASWQVGIWKADEIKPSCFLQVLLEDSETHKNEIGRSRFQEWSVTNPQAEPAGVTLIKQILRPLKGKM